jgi:hypothetical protein
MFFGSKKETKKIVSNDLMAKLEEKHPTEAVTIAALISRLSREDLEEAILSLVHHHQVDEPALREVVIKKLNPTHPITDDIVLRVPPSDSVPLLLQKQDIIHNKTYSYTINDIRFGNLSQSTIYEIFKDGRAFSHLIEPWLEENLPLNHVKGCKQYDFTDMNDEEIKYDAKTFTRRGCYFVPSNMIGEGRTFNKKIFDEKAKNLIYIIVSNVHFPEIKIKFVKGSELIKQYPKGKIGKNEFDKFFN